MLGILVQLLGPFVPKSLMKLMKERPSIGQRIVKYVTPQRSYDIITIIAAIICISAIYQDFPLQTMLNNNIIGLFICGTIGGLFPLIIWKLQRRKIVFNGKSAINKDSLLFLPLTAVSEELIWRYCVPFLLITLFFDSFLLPILISSIGFIMLHLPLGGLKSILYISIFTTFVMVSFVSFGILASIVFHITHNLTISWFRPVKEKTTNFKNTTLSEVGW